MRGLLETVSHHGTQAPFCSHRALSGLFVRCDSANCDIGVFML
jgi:hypothetical protein